MDKKFLKWSLLCPVVLFGLAILGALIYLLSPLAFSALFPAQFSGTNANPCDFSSGISGSQGQISGALGELCQTSQIFLGAAIMILVMLAGTVLSLSWFVAVIDVATSSALKGNDKIIWLIVLFILTFIGAIAYYVVVKRKEK